MATTAMAAFIDFDHNCPVTCGWRPCNDAGGGDWVIERDSDVEILSGCQTLRRCRASIGVTNIGGDLTISWTNTLTSLHGLEGR